MEFNPGLQPIFSAEKSHVLPGRPNNAPGSVMRTPPESVVPVLNDFIEFKSLVIRAAMAEATAAIKADTVRSEQLMRYITNLRAASPDWATQLDQEFEKFPPLNLPELPDYK